MKSYSPNIHFASEYADLSLTDAVEGTFVWAHLEEEYPRTLVQLYRGTIKIFSNQTTSLERCLALMDDKLKEQVVAGLELGTMFVLVPDKRMWAQQTSSTCQCEI